MGRDAYKFSENKAGEFDLPADSFEATSDATVLVVGDMTPVDILLIVSGNADQTSLGRVAGHIGSFPLLGYASSANM